MEFEAFVQIDSPQIEIHPMNFKTELRSRKRLPNKVLLNLLFFIQFQSRWKLKCVKLHGINYFGLLRIIRLICL